MQHWRLLSSHFLSLQFLSHSMGQSSRYSLSAFCDSDSQLLFNTFVVSGDASRYISHARTVAAVFKNQNYFVSNAQRVATIQLVGAGI